MNIIIVGAGEVGRHLAKSLSSQAHNIAVIESNSELAQELDQEIDARVLCANGSSVNALAEANVGECDLFLGLTSDNNTNLVSCSIAKQLGAQKVICRVHPELQREEWLFDHRGHFGIDYIFSSERLSAAELAKSIRNPDSLIVEAIARGRIELQQVYIAEQSPGAGKALRELGLPPRVRIGMISRAQETLIPRGDEILQSGDLVTVFGEANKLQEGLNKLRQVSREEETRNVVIFGGGEYGFSLAQMLEAGEHRIRIFEENSELAQDLTHRLSNTTVINADATSLQELKEERIGETDFFVALSPSDEDNVMSCLQAHNLGAKQCLTLIHRADYADAISSTGTYFGIRDAVSPREATRRELMRFVTSDKYHVVKDLSGSEIIETVVAEKSKISGKSIRNIDWPEGSGIIALVHGVHANVPAADDQIEAGDSIYAIVSQKAKKRFLKLLGR